VSVTHPSATRACNDCRETTTNPWICADCTVLQHALAAFWAVVAAAHPEITSGDFDDAEMRDQCREHIREWIGNNTVSDD